MCLETAFPRELLRPHCVFVAMSSKWTLRSYHAPLPSRKLIELGRHGPGVPVWEAWRTRGRSVLVNAGHGELGNRPDRAEGAGRVNMRPSPFGRHSAHSARRHQGRADHGSDSGAALRAGAERSGRDSSGRGHPNFWNAPPQFATACRKRLSRLQACLRRWCLWTSASASCRPWK